MKHFYSHLIEIESIIIELDSLDLTERQKLHLTALIDSSLHNVILDAILSELEEDDKNKFLQHLFSKDNAKIWELLNKKVDKVEEKIKKAADELKIEMEKDIKEAKRIK